MSQDYRQVALVSDGSSGIGAATVRRLAAAGWDVSFCHRGDEQAVRQVEKAVSELGGRVLAVEVDVTDAADVASWFQQAQDELGPVQAAVSCAGLTRDQPLARLAEADWRAVLDTGLDGMFHICRAAMLAMMKRRSGRIVAVSSVCGAYDHSATHDQAARPWPAHQVPAHHWPVRAGMTGFVPALSALTSRFGVSVNAVTPGPAAHDMTAILPELTRADLTETVALRRFDDASDVADLVTFLLSAACDITGRVLELRRPISLLTPARSPRDRIKRTKATARSANNYAERTVALRSGLRSSPGLRSLPNGLGGGLDELGHLVGWEIIATWPDATSTVVAPMRSANSRSAAGGMASSFAATRNQDGRDFQAGTPITSCRVEVASACWTAYMTLAWTGLMSPAKCFRKSSSPIQAKPSLSMSRWASVGVGAPA